jgi:hypothetical protein
LDCLESLAKKYNLKPNLSKSRKTGQFKKIEKISTLISQTTSLTISSGLTKVTRSKMLRRIKDLLKKSYNCKKCAIPLLKIPCWIQTRLIQATLATNYTKKCSS